MKRSQLQQLIKEIIRETIQKVRRDGMFRTDSGTPQEVIEMLRKVISVSQQKQKNPETLIISPPSENIKVFDRLGLPKELITFVTNNMGDIWAIKNTVNNDQLSFGTNLPSQSQWIYISSSRLFFSPLNNERGIDFAINAVVNDLPKL